MKPAASLPVALHREESQRRHLCGNLIVLPDLVPSFISNAMVSAYLSVLDERLMDNRLNEVCSLVKALRDASFLGRFVTALDTKQLILVQSPSKLGASVHLHSH